MKFKNASTVLHFVIKHAVAKGGEIFFNSQIKFPGDSHDGQPNITSFMHSSHLSFFKYSF